MKKKNEFFRLNKFIDKELYEGFKTFIEKYEKDLEIELITLMFDTVGGEQGYAFRIINLMNRSRLKFFGVAYGRVHSSAVPIFLSTQARLNKKGASALIHRPIKKEESVPDTEIEIAENQFFSIIAEKLLIPTSEVEKLADANDGKGTYITIEHPLGKRFFVSE